MRARLERAAGSSESGVAMEGGAYLYILLCADGSYYTGTARMGLEQRVAEHNSGAYGG
jgi:putative endonuclease